MLTVLVCFYFASGRSFKVPFDNVVMAFVIALFHQILAYISATLYETDGFNYLHRVNGQYLCNQTFRVLSVRIVPTLLVEIVVDLGIVLFLAGFDGMHASTFNPSNGFPYSLRSLTLLWNIALILHSTLIFVKMPVVSRVNSYTLGIHLVLTILISLF